MQILDPAIKCEICGHPILWKESKATDKGKPVHEECLLAKQENKLTREHHKTHLIR